MVNDKSTQLEKDYSFISRWVDSFEETSKGNYQYQRTMGLGAIFS